MDVFSRKIKIYLVYICQDVGNLPSQHVGNYPSQLDEEEDGLHQKQRKNV